MSTVLLRSLLHTAAENHCHPRDVLGFVNRRFAKAVLPGDFATVILARVDPQSGRLAYVSAGHVTAWLLSPEGERRDLESTGIILGIDPDATWESHEYDVVRGERLLVVTDGVTETQTADGRMFGRNRPVELLVGYSELSLDDAIDSMKRALDTFRQGAIQYDDVTIVLAALEDQMPPTNNDVA